MPKKTKGKSFSTKDGKRALKRIMRGPKHDIRVSYYMPKQPILKMTGTSPAGVEWLFENYPEYNMQADREPWHPQDKSVATVWDEPAVVTDLAEAAKHNGLRVDVEHAATGLRRLVNRLKNAGRS